MAGDFRQTLPALPRGTKADELDACIKSSFLWRRAKAALENQHEGLN